MRYGILVTRELPISVYYDALDLTCQYCHHVQPETPPSGLCLRCQMPLRPVLIHERPPRSAPPLSEAQIEQLVLLSTGHANILPHQAILQYQESFYTVTDHPGTWGVVGYGTRKRSLSEALAGAAQVGRALVYLHNNKFVHAEVGGASLESLIVTEGGKSIKLADLSTCTAMSSEEALFRKQLGNDLSFLAHLLCYLATGQELFRVGIEGAPPELRPLIERALRGRYANVQELLADLSLLMTRSQPGALKYSCGQATHPGLKRARNEDAIASLTFEADGSLPVGFYLVADGMGGHEAGDLASNLVKQTLTEHAGEMRKLSSLSGPDAEADAEELLTRAIREANQALFQYARAQGNDLGATATAALLVGDTAVIANIGDTRTYLLHRGHLEQITQDHSLVARLVDVGVITPDEARSHPRRNQVYRCLGHKPEIEVDTFTRRLEIDDVLLLCSDGLWGMVEDEKIRRILMGADTPQRACEALIEAANSAGGEDNIGVVVVRLERAGKPQVER